MSGGNDDIAVCITPIIRPNKPKADAKISITNILMNADGSYASANTHDAPLIPTETPQIILLNPTNNPIQNNETEALNTKVYTY